jgi:hypothetical protein
MPFKLNPGRNPTLKLAYALKDEADRKAKKAAKEPERAEPAAKKTTKRKEKA